MNYKDINNIILLLYNENIENYDIILNKYNIPIEMKEIIKEDLLFVIKIIDFNYQDTIIKINQKLTLNDIINYINFDFIKYSTNPLKIKFIKFNKIIINWLFNINFFEIIYNELNKNELNKNELNKNELNKNELKIKDSQLEIINKLNINGLQTGIHCQSIGCGKSYMIIKYIDYMIKNYTNPKIILFTKKINIMNDIINQLCHISNIEIINRLTFNKKDWIFKIIKSYKPFLLIINKLYIINPDIYKKINYHNLNLILYDECTNIVLDKSYDFLLYCKMLNIPIVGFSSMPLNFDEYKISKIYNIFNIKKSVELNLLTNNNLIYSLNNNNILPFNFYLYQIEKYNTNNKIKNLISKNELNNVINILNQIIYLLPYKKIIAWCDSIQNAIKWKYLFEKYFNNIYNINFGIDNNKNNYDYDKFNNSNNMILFCVSKYRNNFNVKNIDCCIFLDKVSNRSTDIFINTLNKIIKNNKCIIIDNYLDNNNLIIRIINYYLILLNLSIINNIFEIYFNFINSIYINNQDNNIKLNINNVNIVFNFNKKIEINYNDFLIFLQQKLNN